MSLPDLIPRALVSSIVSCTRGVDPAHALATGWSPTKIYLGEDYLAGFLDAAGIELSPEGSKAFLQLRDGGGFKWDPRDTHLPSDVLTAVAIFLEQLSLEVSTRLTNRTGISGRLFASSCGEDPSYFKQAIARSPALSSEGGKAVESLHELQHRIDDVQRLLAEPVTTDAHLPSSAHAAQEALKRVIREREPVLYAAIAQSSEQLRQDCLAFLDAYVPDLGAVTDRLLCDMANVASAFAAYTRELHHRSYGNSNVQAIVGNGVSR